MKTKLFPLTINLNCYPSRANSCLLNSEGNALLFSYLSSAFVYFTMPLAFAYQRAHKNILFTKKRTRVLKTSTENVPNKQMNVKNCTVHLLFKGDFMTQIPFALLCSERAKSFLWRHAWI